MIGVGVTSTTVCARLMPPPSVIKDFDPRFFRPCTFPLLRELGYGTRVSINNGVPADSPMATPMTVSMSVYDNEGGKIATTEPFIDLAPGEIVKLDIDAELERVPGPARRRVRCS